MVVGCPTRWCNITCRILRLFLLTCALVTRVLMEILTTATAAIEHCRLTPYGKSNYVAIMGAGDGRANGRMDLVDPRGATRSVGAGDVHSFNHPAFGEYWGMFGKNSKTTHSNISDGSSNVIMLGERATRDNVDSGEPNAREAGRGAVWAGISFSNNSHYPEVEGDTVTKDAAVFGIHVQPVSK